ncbi:MAG: hypothetical protein K8R23_18290 [Chthoniobacter sp.]|nr:hypothetical protein [Chthoniobacter sp.]
MIPISRIFVSGLAAVCLCASAAGEATPLTPEEISGAARTDELSIPMPGEFMASLNKVGKIDWSKLARLAIGTTYSSRPQNALNLGGLIADGYVAIEAEDAPQIKSIGKDILAIAKNLGLSKEVLERGSSIINFADQKQWDQLKEELEATQNEVKSGMAERKDDDLVTLVTVGGWLRATEVMSGYLAKNYSEGGARLLRQPGIVAFLNKRLEKLGEKTQEDAIVSVVRRKMAGVEKFIAFPLDKPPTAEELKQLSSLISEILKDITKKQNK